MSKALPDLSPREVNIRRAAHLFACFTADGVAEYCAKEGISNEEREHGYARYYEEKMGRALEERVYGSPEYGTGNRP